MLFLTYMLFSSRRFKKVVEGWSYLCRKHFYEEYKRFEMMGKKLPPADT